MSRRLLGVHVLSRLAILTALAVILTRFASVRMAIGGIEAFRAGLGPLPIIMAGVFYGPLAGAMVGAIADIVGFISWPMGPYAPHFTLTSALTGVIPALVILSSGRRNAVTIIVGVAVGQLVTAVYLVPLFLEQLFGMPRAVTVPPRIVSQVLQVPVYVALIYIVEKRMPAALLRPGLAHQSTEA